MNDQTIRELDEAIQLNPEDATNYINRGYAYYKKGNSKQAIEDYDSAVRICSNYETDFIDSHFAHGGREEVGAGVELLDSVISSPPESAADYYYTGLQLLLFNNRHQAQMAFEITLNLGYKDQAKVKRHLENLKNRK